ncbi:MAG: hypothetical protein IPM42_13550 [Saprospiraceae bacterium]|nr:hypothetical protein [Saprospiraceae bacterium]
MVHNQQGKVFLALWKGKGVCVDVPFALPSLKDYQHKRFDVPFVLPSQKDCQKKKMGE